jgi:hypothetical protein
MTVFYLNDPDSVHHPDRIHRAAVLGRPRIHPGTVGWRVEIEPPHHGLRSGILAQHYVGTSLEELAEDSRSNLRPGRYAHCSART